MYLICRNQLVSNIKKLSNLSIKSEKKSVDGRTTGNGIKEYSKTRVSFLVKRPGELAGVAEAGNATSRSVRAEVGLRDDPTGADEFTCTA